MPGSSDLQTFLVDLQPVGRRIQASQGATLLEAVQAVYLANQVEYIIEV
jgi:hypothetical protein